MILTYVKIQANFIDGWNRYRKSASSPKIPQYEWYTNELRAELASDEEKRRWTHNEDPRGRIRY